MNIDELLHHRRAAQPLLDRLTKVFLVGCPKSGTTWVMNQLAGHPRMVIGGEGRFAWRLAPLLVQAFRAFNEDQQKHHAAAAAMLGDADLLLSARQLADSMLLRYIESAAKDIGGLLAVGDKTPQHSQNLGILDRLYPGCRFISIMRDPRDAAVSAVHHFGKTDARPREDYLRHFVREVWPAAAVAVRRAGPGRVLEVRYEDLHRDEPGELRRMLGHIGVDASEAAVRACMEAGSFSSRSGGRARGSEDKGSFYRRGVVGDWRNHLEPALAAELCEPIAALMRECGYDPDPAAVPGAAA